jgi:hypothetical protein
MDPDTVAKGLSILTQVHARLFSGRIQSDRGSHQTVSEPKTLCPGLTLIKAHDAMESFFDDLGINIRAMVHQEAPIMSNGSHNYLGLASNVAKSGGLPSQPGKHAISNCSHQIVSQPRTNDPDVIGMAFKDIYYGTFDENRADLVWLYHETSAMTLDGQKYHGRASIARKLMEMPFEQCEHYISTVDCQPSGPAGDMLVFVSGLLYFRFEGKELYLRFSQIFSLTLTPEGSFVIQNDMLRLNKG